MIRHRTRSPTDDDDRHLQPEPEPAPGRLSAPPPAVRRPAAPTVGPGPAARVQLGKLDRA